MKTPMSFDALEKRAENLSKKYNHEGLARRFASSTVMHPYLFGITSKGKTVIIGPLSENEVDSEGAKLLDAECFYCGTVDVAEATRQIKAELIRRGVDPDEAVSRMAHKIKDANRESAKGREVKERGILSKLFKKKS